MSQVNAVATTPQLNLNPTTPASDEKVDRMITALEKISKAMEKPPAKPQKSAYWKYVAYSVAALAVAYFAGYPKAVQKLASDTVETVGTAAHMAQEIPSAINLAKDAVDSTIAGAYYVGVPLAFMREKVYSAFNVTKPGETILSEREVASLGATFVWKSWFVTKAIAVGSAILAPVAAIAAPVFGRRPVDMVGKTVGAGAFFYTVWQTAVPNEKINEKIKETVAGFVKNGEHPLDLHPKDSCKASSFTENGLSALDTGLSVVTKVANFGRDNFANIAVIALVTKIYHSVYRRIFP